MGKFESKNVGDHKAIWNSIDYYILGFEDSFAYTYIIFLFYTLEWLPK